MFCRIFHLCYTKYTQAQRTHRAPSYFCYCRKIVFRPHGISCGFWFCCFGLLTICGPTQIHMAIIHIISKIALASHAPTLLQKLGTLPLTNPHVAHWAQLSPGLCFHRYTHANFGIIFVTFGTEIRQHT